MHIFAGTIGASLGGGFSWGFMKLRPNHRNRHLILDKNGDLTFYSPKMKSSILGVIEVNEGQLGVNDQFLGFEMPSKSQWNSAQECRSNFCSSKMKNSILGSFRSILANEEVNKRFFGFETIVVGITMLVMAWLSF